MTFASRLQQLVDEKSGGNAADFARLCGVQDSSIRQYLRGTKPSLDNLIAIASAAGASMEWLAVGSKQKNYTEQNSIADPEGVEIPKLQISASAGCGAFATNTNEFEAIRIPLWVLRRLGLRPEHARVLRASGLSMVPTIGDGDLMLVNVSAERRIPVDGNIYVLSVGDAVLVKRLRQTARSWMLSSDNRSLFGDEPVPEDVPVIVHGQVVWVDRMLS